MSHYNMKLGFVGEVIECNKNLVLNVPDDSVLRISQISLDGFDNNSDKNFNAIVYVASKLAERNNVRIGTLCSNPLHSSDKTVDLCFAPGDEVTFTLKSNYKKCRVHICGYATGMLGKNTVTDESSSSSSSSSEEDKGNSLPPSISEQIRKNHQATNGTLEDEDDEDTSDSSVHTSDFDEEVTAEDANEYLVNLLSQKIAKQILSGNNEEDEDDNEEEENDDDDQVEEEDQTIALEGGSESDSDDEDNDDTIDTEVKKNGNNVDSGYESDDEMTDQKLQQQNTKNNKKSKKRKLESNSANSTPKKQNTGQYACNHCTRTFKSETAREQHTQAKHK